MARISKSLSIDPDFYKVLSVEIARANKEKEAGSFSEYIVKILKIIFEPDERIDKILYLKDEIGHESVFATLNHLIHEAIKYQLGDLSE